jgi:hypothetical protein
VGCDERINGDADGRSLGMIDYWYGCSCWCLLGKWTRQGEAVADYIGNGKWMDGQE